MYMNVYQNKGYANREEYLDDVAETYGIERETVECLADLLGPTEDFDGLLSECADCAGTPVMEVTNI
jgi:hypothetical protein